MLTRRKAHKINWHNLHQSASTYCIVSVKIKSLKNAKLKDRDPVPYQASEQEMFIHKYMDGEDWQADWYGTVL